MRYFLPIIVFFVFPLLLSGQVDSVKVIKKRSTKTTVMRDTAKTDTVVPVEIIEKKTKKKAFLSNMTKPKKAFILSMVIPGAGQVYNGQWYKVPVIYGGIAGLVYLLKDNKGKYERFRDAYYQSEHGQPHEFPLLSSDALLFYRKRYFKKMELSYIGLGALYLLNGIDAFVSAHLLTFDVSEDLSLKISPKIFRGTGLSSQLGISVSMRLK